MKTTRIKNILHLSLMGIAMVLWSCTPKPNDPAPSVQTPTGILYFHLHNFISDAEVDGYTFVYTMGESRKISLTMAQFYVSNIQLVKLDGSLYSVPDSVILKTQEAGTYLIANVPVGNYKSVRFYVGLDPTTSQKPASAYSNGVLNQSSMWFGSSPQSGGYVFLNVQGKIDTTSDASGTAAQMQPFAYKLGTAAAYKPVVMPDKNFSVVLNQTQYIHLLADWSAFFGGVTLNNPANLSVTTSAASSSSIATVLINNIPTMFRYED